VRAANPTRSASVPRKARHCKWTLFPDSALNVGFESHGAPAR
jgi:hypothetical protein